MSIDQKETISIWRKIKRWVYPSLALPSQVLPSPGDKEQSVGGTQLAAGSVGSHGAGTVLQKNMAHCGQTDVIADQFPRGKKNPSRGPQKQNIPDKEDSTFIGKSNFHLSTFLIKHYKHRCCLGQSLIMATTVHNILSGRLQSVK